jgi:hypothetical protein
LLAQPSTATDILNKELAAVGIERFTSSAYKHGIVRHVVLFRYKENLTKNQKDEITIRFMALQKSLRNGAPYIASIEEGLQNSGEGVDRGFQQAFLVTFNSEGDRNYYVGQPIVTDAAHYDPNHQKFKDFVGHFLDTDGALVFDYALPK